MYFHTRIQIDLYFPLKKSQFAITKKKKNIFLKQENYQFRYKQNDLIIHKIFHDTLSSLVKDISLSFSISLFTHFLHISYLPQCTVYVHWHVCPLMTPDQIYFSLTSSISLHLLFHHPSSGLCMYMCMSYTSFLITLFLYLNSLLSLSLSISLLP